MAFDVNDLEHQAFRAVAETLAGIDLDPAIDLTEPIDLRRAETAHVG